MNIISIKPQPIPELLGIYSQANAVSVSSSLYFDCICNAKFLGGSSDLSMPELRDVMWCWLGSFCRSGCGAVCVLYKYKKHFHKMYEDVGMHHGKNHRNKE